MTSAKFEFGLGRGHSEEMDISGVVLIQRHGLEQNVVVVVRGDVLRDVDDLVNLFAYLKRVWVHLLADLALESLPVEASHD